MPILLLIFIKLLRGVCEQIEMKGNFGAKILKALSKCTFYTNFFKYVCTYRYQETSIYQINSYMLGARVCVNFLKQ